MSQGNRTGRQAPPHRQFYRGAHPVGTVSEDEVDAIAEKVLSRVRDIRNAQGEGSYVFGDPEHGVYALRIGSAAGEVMLREHLDWLFGVYGAAHAHCHRASFPPLEQVAEDIRAHYGWAQKVAAETGQLGLHFAA